MQSLAQHSSKRIITGVLVAQVQDPKSKKWYATWAEAEPDVLAKGLKLDPSMFPPTPETGEASADADAHNGGSGAAPLHLERTMRFLPHHQDTGGFFVAVLEKVADCSDLVVPTQSHRKRRTQPNVRCLFRLCTYARALCAVSRKARQVSCAGKLLLRCRDDSFVTSIKYSSGADAVRATRI